MTAYWAMLFGLAEQFLQWHDEGHLPKKLDASMTAEVSKKMAEAYGFTNVGNGASGVRVADLVGYLERLGIIRNTAAGYELGENKEVIATWAKLNFWMEKELAAMFDQDGRIKDKKALAKLVKTYSRASELFKEIGRAHV